MKLPSPFLSKHLYFQKRNVCHFKISSIYPTLIGIVLFNFYFIALHINVELLVFLFKKVLFFGTLCTRLICLFGPSSAIWSQSWNWAKNVTASQYVKHDIFFLWQFGQYESFTTARCQPQDLWKCKEKNIFWTDIMPFPNAVFHSVDRCSV